MSKIRLTPNASGTGTVTLTVPSTSTDRTLTLPDTTGTLLDSSGQGGDIWYITANKTTSSGTITLNSNWVRMKDTPPDNSTSPTFQFFDELVGVIGTAMTQSGGLFSFPSTGIWKIEFHACITNSGTGADTYYPTIVLTKDNFTTEGTAILALETLGGSWNHFTSHSMLMDVQDTSNYKCRFEIGSVGNGFAQGNTNYARTYVVFTRLGDT